MKASTLDRRHFLKTAAGGTLALGFWMPSSMAQVAGPLPAKPWTSTSGSAPEINAWLTIAPDDIVTIRVALPDIGTGVFTACAMMIADELQCDWSKVRAEYASINRNTRERAPAWTLPIPGNGQFDPAGAGAPVYTKGADGVYRLMMTGSSCAVRDCRYYLQLAGAEARERLLMAAAQVWKVPKTELTAKDSVITHAASGRTTSYGAVAGLAAQIALPNPETLKIKTPDKFTLMGTERKNLDVPLKVTGEAIYSIDVRLPDMLYASVVSCPVWKGKVKSFDAAAVKAMPGVHSVIEIPPEDDNIYTGAVAVVADSWWRAKKAAEALPIEWDYDAAAGALNSEAIFALHLAAFGTKGKVVTEVGDVASAFAKGKVIEATYQAPYLAHAAMEPKSATVQIGGNRVDLWTGDQYPEEAVRQVSKMTGVAAQDIYMNNCFVGGAFGAKGKWSPTGTFAICHAVRIAQKLNGRPVKLLLTREQDTLSATSYRPAGTAQFKAVLDGDGWPLAIEVKTAGDHNETRGFDRFPYFIPNYRYEAFRSKALHVPFGARRGTGASLNTFFLESFMDELAVAAGKDPYLYRRELIARNPPSPQPGIGGFMFRDDWLTMIDTAAKSAGWGTPLPDGFGRGIAICDRRRASRETATVCCHVHTVSVSRKGQVKVHRVDVAFDEGFSFVNPLTVRKQVEGQFPFGYSDAMHQQITIAKGRAVEGNFDSFPISRMDEYPAEFNVTFVKTGKWIEGVGEEAMEQVAPAITNAVYAVTKKRVRSLPLANHDLAWG